MYVLLYRYLTCMIYYTSILHVCCMIQVFYMYDLLYRYFTCMLYDTGILHVCFIIQVFYMYVV